MSMQRKDNLQTKRNTSVLLVAAVLAVTVLYSSILLISKMTVDGGFLRYLAKDPAIRGTTNDPIVLLLLLASLACSLATFTSTYTLIQLFLQRSEKKKSRNKGGLLTSTSGVIGIIYCCFCFLAVIWNVLLLLPRIIGTAEIQKQSLVLVQGYNEEYFNTYLVVSKEDGRYNQIQLPTMDLCQASLKTLSASTVVIACNPEDPTFPSYTLTIDESVITIKSTNRERVIDLSTCPTWYPVMNTCIFGIFSH